METCEFCKRKAGISATGDTCGAEEYRNIGAGHMLPQVVLDDCLIAALTRERDAAIAEAAGLREMIGYAEKEHHRATKSYADLARDAAGLRARLEEAEARWRSAERQCNNRHCEVPGCPPSRTVITGNISVTKGVRAEWSPADRERRCVEHTTNERAVVKT